MVVREGKESLFPSLQHAGAFSSPAGLPKTLHDPWHHGLLIALDNHSTVDRQPSGIHD